MRSSVAPLTGGDHTLEIINSQCSYYFTKGDDIYEEIPL